MDHMSSPRAERGLGIRRELPTAAVLRAINLETIMARGGRAQGQAMAARAGRRCMEEARLLEQGREHRALAWDGVLKQRTARPTQRCQMLEQGLCGVQVRLEATARRQEGSQEPVAPSPTEMAVQEGVHWVKILMGQGGRATVVRLRVKSIRAQACLAR